ncbi:MAG: orotidine-5'-phosphate decarboxylase [Planctomycetota bacterium]|nr:orotidine-5'-phosphate decarboxylase [Planctomycetota bacterium]
MANAERLMLWRQRQNPPVDKSAFIIHDLPTGSGMTLSMEAVMHFSDRLDNAVKAKGNPICIGLDPRFEQLPKPVADAAIRKHGRCAEAVAEAFIAFNQAIIDAVVDIVPVCKPQIAFYEEYGWQGIRAYEATVRYAKQKGMLVISDAKRGDIGATAAAYARAHLGCRINPEDAGFEADALTVNPYMGRDTLEPFLEVCAAAGRGIFVLVKTSNPGSGDLQDVVTASIETVSERVADMVRALGAKHYGECGLSDVGAVVGATYPEQAEHLRRVMPDTIFLIPGYGAQGATAKDAAAGFRKDGRGAIVNNSRLLVFAYKLEAYATKYGEKDFAGATRAAALKMAEELRAAL